MKKPFIKYDDVKLHVRRTLLSKYYCILFLLISSGSFAERITATFDSPGRGSFRTSSVFNDNSQRCFAGSMLRFDNRANSVPFVEYVFPLFSTPASVSFTYEFKDYGGTIEFQESVNGGWRSISIESPRDATTCQPARFNLSPNATGIRWIQTRRDAADYVALITGGLSIIFDECRTGSSQVALRRNTITNTCPSTTVDLTSLVSSVPAGTTAAFYTTANHSGSPVANPAAAPAGTYYAFYFEAASSSTSSPACFNSDNSTAVITATVTVCAPDPDADTDGDGIKNSDEGSNTSVDTDGDSIPDFRDSDSDNDGIPDSVEKGAASIPADTDGDGVPDFRDLDSDNDGINDVREGGGSSTDTDGDGRADGTANPVTGIPASAGANGTNIPVDTDGDGAPNYRDLDSDNDGLSDLLESGNPAALAADTDNDGSIDFVPASDTDQDGIMAAADGTPTARGDSSDPVPTDTDGDNTPNYIDTRSNGTSDDIDGTPYSAQDANNDGRIDNAADADGDGIADVIDTKPAVFGGLPATNPDADTDGDGIKNSDEGSNTSVDTDGDSIPDFRDLDSDNDGIPDSVEKGAASIPVDTDGDGVPNFRDLDSDNDGINDVREGGGSSTDTDGDGRADGTPDPATGIPASAGANGANIPVDTDGDGAPNYRDLDSDNDGLSDLLESGNPAALAADANNDGTIDFAPSSDSDGDGIMAAADGTPTARGDSSDPVPTDTDGDNTPNYIDTRSNGTSDDIDGTPYSAQDANNDGRIDNAADADGDGIADVIDTKPAVFGGLPATNPDADTDGDGIKNSDEGSNTSVDTDGDSIPDFRDLDSDNDGIPDSVEKGVASIPADTDGDGVPDFRDLDSDNDGINDVREGGGSSTDTDGDGRADGTPDPATGIPASAGANGTTSPVDTDGDGAPNYRDLDSDSDGLSDLLESGNPAALAADADNDGSIDFLPANDTDQDGIMAAADGTPAARGDSSDPVPTDTDGDNTPNYIDTRSNGTSDDIDGTPYSAQDANNDGRIDNAADADGDGIADVIDTKPAAFGGLPRQATVNSDLRPFILLPDANFTSEILEKPLTIRIVNLIAGTTSDGSKPIVLSISKTSDYTLTLAGGASDNWTLTTLDANLVLLTAKAGLTITHGTAHEIQVTIKAKSTTAPGATNLNVSIEDGSGGDANSLNNSASRSIIRN